MGTTSDKLTYLNTTKSNLKDMINYGLDNNNKITNQTTFRNYVSSTFKAFIESLNNPNTLWGNLPKITGEGKEITLNNTIEAPMKLELNPSELEQETTTGKNLFDISKITNTSTIINNNDGTLTITQQFNNPTTQTLSQIAPDLEVGETYFLSFITKDTTFNRLVFANDYWLNGQSKVITQDILDSIVYFYGISGGNNIISNLMINEGSTALPYEPYTGGIASPNPNYEMPVHTITGDNEIKIQNKNLFDKSKSPIYTNGPTYEEAPTGITLISDSSGGSERLIFDLGNIKKFENKTLTYSFSNTPNSLYQYSSLVAINSNGSNILKIGNYLGTNDNTSTTTIGENYSQERLGLSIYLTGANANARYEINNLQVEINSSATSYISHKEQVKEINLGDIEYCEIGDYKDEFYLATDSDTGLVSGKWYIKKNIGKVVLDGSETWYHGASSPTGSDQLYTDKFDNMFTETGTTGLTKIKCNYFINSDTVNGMRIGSYVSFFPESSLNMTTASAFKTWLSTHNTTVYYVLATPTYTLLNNTLQTQLEDIYNTLKSYNGQTLISQNNNDLEFTISASALLDLNSLVS